MRPPWLSTSAFYAWRDRQANPPPKMRADAELTAVIVAIHTQSRGVYGSPPVHAELTLGLGHRLDVTRVVRLMRQAGIPRISHRPRPARLHPPTVRCGAV